MGVPCIAVGAGEQSGAATEENGVVTPQTIKHTIIK